MVVRFIVVMCVFLIIFFKIGDMVLGGFLEWRVVNRY